MKLIFITLILFCICFSIQAQITIIPKAGLSLTSFRYIDTKNEWKTYNQDGESFSIDKKIGFGGQLGIEVAFPLTSNFYLQPSIGVAYKSVGLVSEYSEESRGVTYKSTTEAKANAMFFEPSLLFRYDIGSEESAFYFLLGPTMSLAFTGNGKISATINDPYSNPPSYSGSSEGSLSGFPKEVREGALNPMGFAFTGGVGYRKSVGNFMLFADIRYQYGLTSYTNKDYEDGELYGAQIFLNTASLNVGLGFPLN